MRILNIEVPKEINETKRALRVIELDDKSISFITTHWTPDGCSRDNVVVNIPADRRDMIATFIKL